MAELDSLTEVASTLNLADALNRSAIAGDLFPPRPDDKIAGGVADRFVQALQDKVESGTYLPDPAVIVPVPKSGHTTRPASLLTLADRTVFRALIDKAGPRIEGGLLGPEVVFAHRATEERRPWSEFLADPLRHEPRYVVKGDLFGYYEVLPHDRLVSRMVEVTGDRPVSYAIGALLGRIMRARRGLPQGNRSSDILASIYLDSVDRSMLRNGFLYVRHGDDIRIAVRSYSAGREAIAALEREVRNLELFLNGAKTMVLRASTYERQLQDADAARDALKNRIHQARLASLRQRIEVAESPDELEGLLTDDLLWDLYAGGVNLDDIVARMKPLLEPDVTSIAEQLLRDTLKRAPWTPDGLRRESFHGRFVRSLTLLTAARSHAAMEHLDKVLFRMPELTKEVAHYLRALASDAPEEVRDLVIQYLQTPRFRPGWQEVWLHDVLQQCLPLGEEFNSHLMKMGSDEGPDWLSRTSAVTLLARQGSGDRALLERMWQLAPPVFRSDVIASAAWLEPRLDWAAPFLEGCRGDATHEAVVVRVRQLRDAGVSQS